MNGEMGLPAFSAEAEDCGEKAAAANAKKRIASELKKLKKSYTANEKLLNKKQAQYRKETTHRTIEKKQADGRKNSTKASEANRTNGKMHKSYAGSWNSLKRAGTYRLFAQVIRNLKSNTDLGTIDPARKYYESRHSGLDPESSRKPANTCFERADTGFRWYDVLYHSLSGSIATLFSSPAFPAKKGV